MYTLLDTPNWNQGRKYSIFGIPDIGNFSVAFGSSNPYQVALQNVNKNEEIKKTQNIAKVEGMKEGALSAPIIYYERDVRSQDGKFMPKVETKKITKIFEEPTVKINTKNLTVSTLENKLHETNQKLKSEFGKDFNPLNKDLFTGQTINNFDPHVAASLQLEKRNLEEKLFRTRPLNPKKYKNMNNFSQLVKGPETIMTIADDFTIFDRNAYFDAKQNKKDIHERINDIRSPLNKIPKELMGHFDIKDLMGPPELIPTGKEAYRREFSNPLNRPKIDFYTDTNTLDIPKVNFTPNKSKKVESKITELHSPFHTNINTDQIRGKHKGFDDIDALTKQYDSKEKRLSDPVRRKINFKKQSVNEPIEVKETKLVEEAKPVEEVKKVPTPQKPKNVVKPRTPIKKPEPTPMQTPSNKVQALPRPPTSPPKKPEPQPQKPVEEVKKTHKPLTYRQKEDLKSKLAVDIEKKINDIRSKYFTNDDVKPPKEIRKKLNKLKTKQTLLEMEDDRVLNKEQFRKYFPKQPKPESKPEPKPETKSIEDQQKEEARKKKMENEKKKQEAKERRERAEKLKEEREKARTQPRITSDQQTQLYLKLKGDLNRELVYTKDGKVSQALQVKTKNKKIQEEIKQLDENFHGSKSMFTHELYTKYF